MRPRLLADRPGGDRIDVVLVDAHLVGDQVHALLELVHLRADALLVFLEDVEALLSSDALIVDACRFAVRRGSRIVHLANRPVLFSLARALAEAAPDDVPRGLLLARAFGARHADESHRARLRVEIGRLRAELEGLAAIEATKEGFVLVPVNGAAVAVLAPPIEDENGAVLALLADGESWSSTYSFISFLNQALNGTLNPDFGRLKR